MNQVSVVHAVGLNHPHTPKKVIVYKDIKERARSSMTLKWMI